MQSFVKIMMSKYRGRFLRLHVVQIPCHPNTMLSVALRWPDDGSLLFKICRWVLFWKSSSTGTCKTECISNMARVCYGSFVNGTWKKVKCLWMKQVLGLSDMWKEIVVRVFIHDAFRLCTWVLGMTGCMVMADYWKEGVRLCITLDLKDFRECYEKVSTSFVKEWCGLSKRDIK